MEKLLWFMLFVLGLVLIGLTVTLAFLGGTSSAMIGVMIGMGAFGALLTIWGGYRVFAGPSKNQFVQPLTSPSASVVSTTPTSVESSAPSNGSHIYDPQSQSFVKRNSNPPPNSFQNQEGDNQVNNIPQPSFQNVETPSFGGENQVNEQQRANEGTTNEITPEFDNSESENVNPNLQNEKEQRKMFPIITSIPASPPNTPNMSTEERIGREVFGKLQKLAKQGASKAKEVAIYARDNPKVTREVALAVIGGLEAANNLTKPQADAQRKKVEEVYQSRVKQMEAQKESQKDLQSSE